MIIANRSIHIIDYENNRILSRDIPATFDEYVGELIFLSFSDWKRVLGI